MNQSQKILVKNLKEKGVSKNSNWLESKEIDFFKKIIQEIKRSKGDPKSHLPFKKSQIFLKVIKG